MCGLSTVPSLRRYVFSVSIRNNTITTERKVWSYWIVRYLKCPFLVIEARWVVMIFFKCWRRGWRELAQGM